MTQIQQAVERAKKQHGGLRKAAVALGVDPGYLCRLAKGQKSNPAPALLEKLGIERCVTYRKIRTMRCSKCNDTGITAPGGKVCSCEAGW